MNWFEAATTNNLDYIIQNTDANKGTANKEGQTALMLSAINNNVQIIRHLINIESKLSNSQKMTALMFAAFHNRFEAVTELVKTESKLQNQSGKSALMMAAYNGNLNICNALLCECGLVDSQGKTALCLAVQKGHVEVIKLLYNHEVGITVNGQTMEQIAEQRKMPNIVVLIKELKQQYFEQQKIETQKIQSSKSLEDQKLEDSNVQLIERSMSQQKIAQMQQMSIISEIQHKMQEQDAIIAEHASRFESVNQNIAKLSSRILSLEEKQRDSQMQMKQNQLSIEKLVLDFQQNLTVNDKKQEKDIFKQMTTQFTQVVEDLQTTKLNEKIINENIQLQKMVLQELQSNFYALFGRVNTLSPQDLTNLALKTIKEELYEVQQQLNDRETDFSLGDSMYRVSKNQQQEIQYSMDQLYDLIKQKNIDAIYSLLENTCFTSKNRQIEYIKTSNKAQCAACIQHPHIDKNGNSLLMYATYYNKPDLCRMFIQQTGLKNKFGCTALFIAVLMGHLECVQLLKCFEAKKTYGPGIVCYQIASDLGWVNVMNELESLEKQFTE
ncbi:Ankyrin_repeat protein 1 [Hexamita inflata]|uniref:Ankyrin repeat protein 1 n=1 Tax=Hexamita inflata TaxID=28002 RepID=A0AA86UBN4_9EUKA|nr:Ankyrin repeat protein 1 [Hexamita inflata]